MILQLLAFQAELLLLLLIPIFILLTVVLITNYQNRRMNDISIVSPAKKNFIIRFDETNQKVYFYRRKLTITEEVMTYSDFYRCIPPHQQKLWDDYIHRVKDGKLSNNDYLVINLAQLFDQPSHWIKINLRHCQTSSIYFNAIEVNHALFSNKKIAYNDLISPFMFQKKVIELNNNTVRTSGAIICLNYYFFDVISHRYGIDIANRYLLEVWKNLHEINGEGTVAGHYNGDYFVIYLHNVISKKQIQNFIKRYINVFNRSVDLDIYHFEVTYSIGVCILGEFGEDIDLSIKSAVQASNRALRADQDIVFYDSLMDSEEKERIQESLLLNAVFETKPITPRYFPVISLHNANIVGYFAEMDFSKTQFLNFNSIYHVAAKKQVKEELFATVFSTWIEHFRPVEGHPRLFVFGEVGLLDTLLRIYEDYKKTQTQFQLIYVITDYQELINSDKQVSDAVRRVKDHGISFGVVGDERMVSAMHPILLEFEYLVLPAKMTRLISTNPRIELLVDNILSLFRESTVIPVAWNIIDYSQAEILKNLGVMMMNGPLFDNREGRKSSQKYSIRKISKLIDD